MFPVFSRSEVIRMYQFDVIFGFLYLLLFFFYLKFFMNIIDMRVILFLNKKIQIFKPSKQLRAQS